MSIHSNKGIISISSLHLSSKLKIHLTLAALWTKSRHSSSFGRVLGKNHSRKLYSKKWSTPFNFHSVLTIILCGGVY